jgi:hypothetical protein
MGFLPHDMRQPIEHADDRRRVDTECDGDPQARGSLGDRGGPDRTDIKAFHLHPLGDAHGAAVIADDDRQDL